MIWNCRQLMKLHNHDKFFHGRFGCDFWWTRTRTHSLVFELFHFRHLSGEGQSFIACGKDIPVVAHATVAPGNDGHDLRKQHSPWEREYKESRAFKFPCTDKISSAARITDFWVKYSSFRYNYSLAQFF